MSAVPPHRTLPRAPLTLAGDGVVLGWTTAHRGTQAIEQPAGAQDGDWIQTAPDKGWFVILRLHSRLQAFFDQSWQVSEIEPSS